MAIFASFVHCLPNIDGHTTAFRWFDCQWPWAFFKVIGLFHIKFLKNCVWYGKSYYRQLIGNHTLAFDWCHVWWPWSTFEGHFSLACHFHVHFRYPWHAFASHGLPAIAELLDIDHISYDVTNVGKLAPGGPGFYQKFDSISISCNSHFSTIDRKQHSYIAANTSAEQQA